jgi:hypothetical protein
MQLLRILALVGLTVASVPQSSQPSPELALIGPPKTQKSHNITTADIHAHVLKTFRSDHITTTKDLHNYFGKHYGSKHTVYLSDTQSFVSMESVKPKTAARSNSVHARQVGCWWYTTAWTIQQAQYWDMRKIASGCLSTGASDAGGSRTITWEASASISYTGSLDWGLITDVMTASLSITVTQEWSKSDSVTCNVNANSVVQVWETTWLAWAHFNAEDNYVCSTGVYPGATYDAGTAAAPAAQNNGYWIGCSTGWDKVSC